jgi:hypothetical protein
LTVRAICIACSAKVFASWRPPHSCAVSNSAVIAVHTTFPFPLQRNLIFAEMIA